MVYKLLGPEQGTFDLECEWMAHWAINHSSEWLMLWISPVWEATSDEQVVMDVKIWQTTAMGIKGVFGSHWFGIIDGHLGKRNLQSRTFKNNQWKEVRVDDSPTIKGNAK